MEPVRQATRRDPSWKWEGQRRPDARRHDATFAAEHEARILAHIRRTEAEQAARALPSASPCARAQCPEPPAT